MASIVAASVVFAGSSDTSVADRIRDSGSPLIQEVTYHGANLLDSALTTAWLTPGASDADADRFWCDVVVVSGGHRLMGRPAP